MGDSCCENCANDSGHSRVHLAVLAVGGAILGWAIGMVAAGGSAPTVAPAVAAVAALVVHAHHCDCGSVV